ncbi:MAG: hypothetical protein WBX15_05620 [Thermoanaerobaculia bacterium]
MSVSNEASTRDLDTRDATIGRVLAFFAEIGLSAREGPLPEKTFLPGVTIDRGALLFDRDALEYPGDLLHEAGHVAFAPPEIRATLTSESSFELGEEIAAIAWSWAALVHLRLDPEIVFHGGGYRGTSRAFIENFSTGHYAGVPMLEWAGMTFEPRRGRETPVSYPAMLHWLRP